jgi:quinol monooxygenase YgiN
VWTAGNAAAPKFYRAGEAGRYSVYELREDQDHLQIHYASDNYTWQRQLADFVRQQTDLQVSQVEYRVP